jgi:hypothetical protein
MAVQNYTKEELWKLYEKLPPVLQEAIFSEENADHINRICERYGLKEEQIPKVAKFSGRVLMGLMLPEDFLSVLKKEVGLKDDIAKQIAHEINRFVFAPVKDYLAQLHRIEKQPEKGTTPPPTIPEEIEGTKKRLPESVDNELKGRAQAHDIYREPIE